MKHARQKKNFEIDINLLAAKRDAMEAQAELQVIDEEFNSETGSTSSRSSVKLASEKLHRTKQYIIQQSSLSSSAQKIETVIEKETENNTNELITKEENSFLEYNHPQEPELVDNTTKYSVENNIDVAMVTVSKSSEKQEVLETGEIDIAQETLIDSSNISSALQVTTNPVLQQETNPQSFSCPPLVKGPPSVSCDESDLQVEQSEYVLIQPEQDKEVRPVVKACKTMVSQQLGTERFSRFSSWKRLVCAISKLRQIYIKYHHEKHSVIDRSPVELYKFTEKFILKEVQKELYPKEVICLKNKQSLPKDSSILSLSPMLDDDGLLRVDGRLNRGNLSVSEQNPIIVSGKHHISTLLVRHYHEKTHHQGRHITEGTVRSAGYWITGGKRLIYSILHNCVVCKKLRGKTEHQIMSDLPVDRVIPCPPFTYVGVDNFGPWSISTRRTRGGQANSKPLAIMFSCLASRGIHIEVVEELTSSSFINALRRFIALRGQVKEFRSDRGTNFIGATKELNMNIINVEDKLVQKFLLDNGTSWKFNAPHSSHMAGKVCAIVNARPIVAVSTDPEAPTVLSPSSLITQKTNTNYECFGHIDMREMYRSQWKLVQILANDFWTKWKQQYLQNQQSRTKWCEERNNLKQGDIVLLKDNDLVRNQWSVGVILETFPSEDGRIRKVSVRITKNNNSCTYTRPIKELVYLLSP
ncbi:unnamed protein product [Mytilus edulis]|uniref:DUF5641 domain-containing protein n=1 Tax=Mytilus edulis TaxID=6550 RepID=A0A8S3QD77_MYTED|nr:unnamed protein product [Mytilus edulis]